MDVFLIIIEIFFRYANNVKISAYLVKNQVMATVPDFSNVFLAIDNLMSNTADIESYVKNGIKILEYLSSKFNISRTEMAIRLNLENVVQEFLSGRWGTEPCDTQCQQLFQYMIEEKMLTAMEIKKVLERTVDVII